MEKINFVKDIKNLFGSVWNLVKDILRGLKRLLDKLNWRIIKKIVGVIAIIVSYFWIIVESVGGMMMIIDPIQFNNIIYGFFGVNLFSYIGPGEYYSMLIGALVMDLIFWIIVAMIGWYLVGKKVKGLKNAVVTMGTLFVAGAFLFGAGLFYALPDIKIPVEHIEKIANQKYIDHMIQKMEKDAFYDQVHNDFRGRRY